MPEEFPEQIIQLNRGLLIKPQRLSSPNAWMGHIPFGAWLVCLMKPSLLTELGTHSGNSYLALCQAVQENNLSTKCFAVDTWKGDEHSGSYDESIYEELSQYHDKHYSHFSHLLRMTFDEGLAHFNDGSIDLLHIDGLHTYEAVKHDFESWLPKMSKSGVVLFHDINVREKGFGVWLLWQELSAGYPGFEFEHSHGLGVLLLGSKVSSHLQKWVSEQNNPQIKHLTKLHFEQLGQNVLRQHEVMILRQQLDAKEIEIKKLASDLNARKSEVTQLGRNISALKDKIIEQAHIIRSAEQWQRRSWLMRAFHRWRPSNDRQRQQKVGFMRRLERSIRKRRKRVGEQAIK